VITAWETGRDGRKRIGEAAVHGESGTLLAVARATGVAVDRQVQLGRASGVDRRRTGARQSRSLATEPV